jgi:hypothetical protein
MSHIDSYTAKKMHKAFHGLYLDMQRSFAECNALKLNPVTKPFDSRINPMQLPLPADMRTQLLSSNGNSQSMEYFPDEIQHHILNEPGVAITYKFEVVSRKVVLHFVEFNTHNPDMKKMQAHAKRVCALMHLVSTHASRIMCSSTLNVYIYMTEFKKRFPTKKGEAIDTEHANTGMSYHCAKANDIVVYRKEEWFKVLIHESFHAFGLGFIENDMPEGMDQAMQAMLQKTYSISHPVRIYETYCEIWARILNVMFDCFVDDHATPVYGGSTSTSTSTSNNSTEFPVFMECVMEGLDANARFAQQQCAKLLRYTDISYETLTQPTEPNRAIVLKKYRESTNVFAYYVMTCALLHSPNEFMAWCHKNNPLTPDKKGIMQFRTIPANFNGFMELLYHCKQQCPKLEFAGLNDADVMGSSMRMSPNSYSQMNGNLMKN